jgi:predicted RNA-binding protein YlxR (DUF448 family)
MSFRQGLMAGKQPGRPKHIPQRTCVVCRRQYDKRRLTRVVRTPDSGVVIDPTGKRNGRGAYLCDQPECWDKALRQASILNGALNAQLTEVELAAIAADPRRPAAAQTVS